LPLLRWCHNCFRAIRHVYKSEDNLPGPIFPSSLRPLKKSALAGWSRPLGLRAGADLDAAGDAGLQGFVRGHERGPRGVEQAFRPAARAVDLTGFSPCGPLLPSVTTRSIRDTLPKKSFLTPLSLPSIAQSPLPYTQSPAAPHPCARPAQPPACGFRAA